MFPKKSVDITHIKPIATNVHVNPNFKPQNRAIHINPKIHAKPLIHVNPKMMHNIAASNQNLQNNVCTINTNSNSNALPTNIKRSVYVNPKLITKLSSKDKPANPKESSVTRQCAFLKSTPVENVDNRNISSKKASDTGVVLLSLRKLVRVAHAPHNGLETSRSQYKLQKSVDLTEKKSGTISKKVVKALPLTNHASVSAKGNLLKLVSGKSKVSKYKIDRTALSKLKRDNRPKTRGA